jgi:hypothetical protein
MKWFVILRGAQWRDIDPEVFAAHEAIMDCSTIVCDEVDVSGEMIELRWCELKILVPYDAVIAAVAAPDEQIAQRFHLRKA